MCLFKRDLNPSDWQVDAAVEAGNGGNYKMTVLGYRPLNVTYVRDIPMCQCTRPGLILGDNK